VKRNEALNAIVEELEDAGVAYEVEQARRRAHFHVRFRSPSGQPELVVVSSSTANQKSVRDARSVVRRLPRAPLSPGMAAKADRVALDAVHKAQDICASKAYVARLAAKNRRDACKPTREEAFAAQLMGYRERAEFELAELQRRRRQDEARMQRWCNARGEGLRDW
jgi:hypothetical protein